ncbi:APC family permease [Conexibacter sp. DBS9H8]|uniref:APC family permease n=1 Tax=Conexibacter sp. DBS9H8 TaxID=2937801 RepID=UPI00200DB303|nr:APC family permease [Conexibacter sp. DBS9H8]
MSALERRFRPRAGKHADGGHELGVIGGLSALSLDALSSVAYGPDAMVAQLLAGGVAALTWTLPIALVITGMLILLVISYSQVIAAFPDGGGAYAVSKAEIGSWASLLAAASLVVDYTLTVAVSLAAGAAALGSAFPALSHHLLLICLVALVTLTALNWFGIAESAKALMPFTAVFVLSTLAIVVVGPFHSHPAAVIGTREHFPVVEALGVVLILKAFAAGCSALTGVEAIANGTPAFRAPRVRTAQRTELLLGLLLGVMLVGLCALIKLHHVSERSGVTILAQLAAGAFGKGILFYVSNLSVAAVLGLAANTSFGGLPVVMSLLARDHRLPHMFYLRGERPVFRHGIAALAIAAALLLTLTGANVNALIPMYAIGVFIGFTLSQFGLVRRWRAQRPARWRLRIALNGTGMMMSGLAAVIFVFSKFTEGAWVLVIVIPGLIFTFHRIERYYAEVGRELRLGFTPPRPVRRESVVIVPTTTVSLLTERALSAALSLGETVIAVAVAGNEEERRHLLSAWDEWDSAVPLEVLIDKHRSLLRPVYRYVRQTEQDSPDTTITVLIPEILPRKRRHEILHNQRGRLLAAVLRARTDVVIATLGLHLHD